MKKTSLTVIPLILFALSALAGNTISDRNIGMPNNRLSFENLRFSYTTGSLFNKSDTTLSEKGKEALDELAMIAKGHNMDTIEVYIPAKTSETNTARELAIRSYLSGKGIPEYSIKFVKNMLGETPATIEINLTSSAVATRKHIPLP